MCHALTDEINKHRLTFDVRNLLGSETVLHCISYVYWLKNILVISKCHIGATLLRNINLVILIQAAL